MFAKSTFLLFALLFTLHAQPNYTQYVDPFIGTGGHGHTFPGATLPFGMVQLSPDTDTQGWDWCSGYHASDSSLMGFSHTHLSGTGGADYGDIMLLPFTGNIEWQPGDKDNPDAGYRARFSHKNESARPGYYQVFLPEDDINVALTVSKRVGFHKYTFPANDSARVLVDLEHGISDQVRHSYLNIISDREIEGLRRSRGWASDQYVYFVIQFSKPFIAHTLAEADKAVSGGRAKGKSVKGVFDFQTEKGEAIYAKVALSPVSAAGARKNLQAEIPHWDFSKVVKAADAEWQNWLQKIQVEGGSKADKRVFYTALYHSLIAPNLYMDVDGQYRGRDLEIHRAEDFTYYTLFSLWDTFRATHPLFTLIAPEQNQDFIRTMIMQYEQGEDLPIWELSANETGTMIGYHSVPVIVDAYMKGQRNFDAEKALAAMKNSAMRDDRGLKQYRNMGYIPTDQEANSVSKAVEYAYDDWCIAQMAKAMGRMEDYETYIKRAQQYLNHFDKESGFMRGRFANGRWRSPFDPRKVSHLGLADFTEGNSWQYTFFVPHNVNHLMNLFGGDAAMTTKLDQLFSESEMFGLESSPDVTGLIGNYAHGNEPSHHIAYLYNYTGAPWRSQEMVHQIKTTLYNDQRDGLSGNEDCGQMSAWYIFSALGFYPVCPGQNEYVIGTPTFEKVTLHTGAEKPFTIHANPKAGFYVQDVTLNGDHYVKNYLPHSAISNGSDLKFKLRNSANKNWGSAVADRAKSWPIEENFTMLPVEESQAMMPFFDNEEVIFSERKQITLQTLTIGADIRYTLDGSDPTENATLYDGPFEITESAQVEARTFKKGIVPSAAFKRQYTKVDVSMNENMTIRLKHSADSRYNKGGAPALLDRKLGPLNFHDPRWLGFEKVDMDAIIDFGEALPIAEVTTRFFRGNGSWIHLPTSVACFRSENGVDFTLATEETLPDQKEMLPDEIRKITLNLDGTKTRYLRLVAKNIGKNPKWHPSPGGGAWVFVDEILIQLKK